MATDIRIYKRQHDAFVSAETTAGMSWIASAIGSKAKPVMTFQIPSDVVGEFAEEVVRAGLIVEIKT